MPYMREHIDRGIQTSLVLVGLPMWAHTGGIIPTHPDLVGPSVYAVIGIVVGSDLHHLVPRSVSTRAYQVRCVGSHRALDTIIRWKMPTGPDSSWRRTGADRSTASTRWPTRSTRACWRT